MSINLLESLSDNIKVDKDKCTACGICVDTCILDNLRLKLAPCRQACPLGVNCQGYVQLIARGEEEQAKRLLRETLPFSAILGRLCSGPCEVHCHRRNIEGEAVAIRALKRYLYDSAGSHEDALPVMAPQTDNRVAIVGSGPAGIMAAYDLRVKGHEVTIFEALSAPGGMLRWAIPEFRLPLGVLESELSLLYRMGIELQCGISIGTDLSIDDLKSKFDAILLTTGCPKYRPLDTFGENQPGVLQGLPFLRKVRAKEPIALGKKVVIIGGGNVAVNVAQTVLRLGSDSVTMVTLESKSDLLAFTQEVESAISEGVNLECSWGHPELVFEGEKLSVVTFQRCLKVFDESGCFGPLFDDSQIKKMDADTVIIAIGQLPDVALLESAGVLEHGVLTYNPLTLQTKEKKIFIAGDAQSGPSSVVEAMASGRRAAESADRFLKGEHLEFGRRYPGPIETEFEIEIKRGSKDSRTNIPKCEFKGKGNFEEMERVLDEISARREAKRCYSCGEPFGKYRTCWFCLPCEVECPHKALYVQIPYLLR
jgi:NADPH-dependent glutamate synthase beta subunit-like oxidoreductase